MAFSVIVNFILRVAKVRFQLQQALAQHRARLQRGSGQIEAPRQHAQTHTKQYYFPYFHNAIISNLPFPQRYSADKEKYYFEVWLKCKNIFVTHWVTNRIVSHTVVFQIILCTVIYFIFCFPPRPECMWLCSYDYVNMQFIHCTTFHAHCASKDFSRHITYCII